MILFTADWHIKLGQKNVPVSWARNRYEMFFEKVFELEKDINTNIIRGDIFDRVPTMEDLKLYFDFVKRASVETIIFDGNHEATRKNKTFFSQLKDVTSNLNSKVSVIDYCDVVWGILPYCELHKKDWGVLESYNGPVFTHVRGEVPPHVKPEIDLERLAKFPVVFAGDLHAHSNSQKNIVYPGSPMTTSFHRAEVETGYLLIDPSDWSWTWHKFELPQLIRKTVSASSDMKPTEFHHTIYEVQGDMQDLASVENSELLDKKIVTRTSEETLILKKDMTIQDELVEYLTYVLEIPETNIPQIVGLYNDYTSKIDVG